MSPSTQFHNQSNLWRTNWFNWWVYFAPSTVPLFVSIFRQWKVENMVRNNSTESWSTYFRHRITLVDHIHIENQLNFIGIDFINFCFGARDVETRVWRKKGNETESFSIFSRRVFEPQIKRAKLRVFPTNGKKNKQTWKREKIPFNFYSQNHYTGIEIAGCFDVLWGVEIVKINVKHVAFVFEM